MMKNIEIAIKRLEVTYYAIICLMAAYFIFEMLTLAFDFDHARDDFRRGFAYGRKSATNAFRDKDMLDDAEVLSFRDEFYNPPIGAEYRTVSVVDNDSIKVEATISHFDLKISTNGMMLRPPLWKFLSALMGVLTFGAFVWWIVVAVRLFVKMGSSVRKRDIFNMRLIKLHKWFAISLVIAFSLRELNGFADKFFVSKYLEGTEWQFSMDWPLPWTILLIGVVFYIISEILKMGYILKEEQELTI